MTKHLAADAVLESLCLNPYYSYLFEGYTANSLLELTVGRCFDRDGCPVTVTTTLLEMPSAMFGEPWGCDLLRQWVSRNLQGWQYLSATDFTGVACPVGGWPEDNTPF